MRVLGFLAVTGCITMRGSIGPTLAFKTSGHSSWGVDGSFAIGDNGTLFGVGWGLQAPFENGPNAAYAGAIVSRFRPWYDYTSFGPYANSLHPPVDSPWFGSAIVGVSGGRHAAPFGALAFGKMSSFARCTYSPTGSLEIGVRWLGDGLELYVSPQVNVIYPCTQLGP